jgi:hypothetical protein
LSAETIVKVKKKNANRTLFLAIYNTCLTPWSPPGEHSLCSRKALKASMQERSSKIHVFHHPFI